MAEDCVADTGPLLHLAEIGRMEMITIFGRVLVSSLIARELREYGVAASLGQLGKLMHIRRVHNSEAEAAQSRLPQFRIGVEDASCLILAERTDIRVVLTDDFELRMAVKAQGRQPVGSIGVLVKNFVLRRINEAEFRGAVEMLLNESTLFISRSFRQYVRSKVEDTIRSQGKEG